MLASWWQFQRQTNTKSCMAFNVLVRRRNNWWSARNHLIPPNSIGTESFRFTYCIFFSSFVCCAQIYCRVKANLYCPKPTILCFQLYADIGWGLLMIANNKSFHIFTSLFCCNEVWFVSSISRVSDLQIQTLPRRPQSWRPIIKFEEKSSCSTIFELPCCNATTSFKPLVVGWSCLRQIEWVILKTYTDLFPWSFTQTLLVIRTIRDLAV